MKKNYFLLLISLHIIVVGQQYSLDLLYEWSDETISGDNWVGNVYNEIWGFVQNEHEFAVIGSTQGTHIFDVTDPENSYLVTSIDGGSTSPDVVHRDFHTYNGYLYAVADEMESSTLQIMNLSNLPNSVEVVYDSNDIITRSHNIFIDENNGIMYVCGGKVNGSNNNLCLLSLAEPENPVFISTYDTHGYVHDIYIKDNIAYLNAGNNGLHIVDFSDINNPQTLGSLTDYPYQGYNHSGWGTLDGNTYVFADENHGYKMKICDVSNPNEIIVSNTLLSDVDDESMAHNLIIKDNLLFVSHYHDGLWIWDISNPENPIYIASYDTYINPGHDSYKGAWGVYPLLPSGNILVSDMQSGLFVFALNENTSKINEEIEYQIFPNPFNSQLNIKCKSNQTTKIEIFDIYGKSILTENTISVDNILTLEQLKPGIYSIRIQNSTNTHEQKIVKY